MAICRPQDLNDLGMPLLFRQFQSGIAMPILYIRVRASLEEGLNNGRTAFLGGATQCGVTVVRRQLIRVRASLEEGLNNRGMTLPDSGCQSGITPSRMTIRISTSLKKGLDNRGMTLPDGCCQHGIALSCVPIRVRARLKKGVDSVGIAAPGGRAQCGVAGTIPIIVFIRISTGFEEGTNDLSVVPSRFAQCGISVFIFHIRVRTRLKEGFDSFGVAVLGGPDQRGMAVLILHIEISAGLKEGLDAFGVAVLGGPDQRGMTVCILPIGVRTGLKEGFDGFGLPFPGRYHQISVGAGVSTSLLKGVDGVRMSSFGGPEQSGVFLLNARLKEGLDAFGVAALSGPD